MIDVEVIGAEGARAERARLDRVAAMPTLAEIRRLCRAAAGSAGVHSGHLAIEFVDAARIAALNAAHRNEPGPTDVLSFPIDGAARGGDTEAVELGDVLICLQHTRDVREAIVHGVLHLLGMDHDADDGEMLARQRELLQLQARPAKGPS
jgi:probable rRNA maturation factor